MIACLSCCFHGDHFGRQSTGPLRKLKTQACKQTRKLKMSFEADDIDFTPEDEVMASPPNLDAQPDEPQTQPPEIVKTSLYPLRPKNPPQTSHEHQLHQLQPQTQMCTG
eukprot:5331941-Amphidinium_carterae.1